MANVLIGVGIIGLGGALAAKEGYGYLKRLRLWADGIAEQNGFTTEARGKGAFRHALVSAELERKYKNENLVKWLGDLNELTNSNGEGVDRNQDLWNNKVGRDIGKTSNSEQDSIDKVRDATNKSLQDPFGGPLVVRRDEDPRVKPENFPSELAPHLYPSSQIPLGDANGDGIPDIHQSKIPPSISAPFTAAQAWRRPLWRDPLTLDLDGDGLETVGINTRNPILFDHTGDGIKQGTGWVRPDDGFLVLDRNGNGSIDNGTELFGDSTPLYTGGKAADGFAALAQEDTNRD